MLHRDEDTFKRISSSISVLSLRLRQTLSSSPDDFTDVGRDEIANELFRVFVDRASFFNRLFDGRKVVVGQNDIRGEFRH